MKTFAGDVNPIDIEELTKVCCLNDERKAECSSKSKCCSVNSSCNRTCTRNKEKKVHIINAKNEWYAPRTMDDLYSLLNEYKGVKYRLVGGNTGVGVFKNEGPHDIYIDFKNVPDLFAVVKTANSLTIGAGITLSKLIDILNQNSGQSGFEYLDVVSRHMQKIAVSIEEKQMLDSNRVFIGVY
jgi:xanthine dehydrogenase iron-sulfur cluster and FAD-binding subunit A